VSRTTGFWLIGGGLVLALGLAAAPWLAAGLVLHHAPRKKRASSEFDRIATEAEGRIEKAPLRSSDGVALAAWLLPAAPNPGADRFGVVMTHGGGDDKAYYLSLALRLQRAGYDVILPDLRGHGESAPSPKGLTLGVTESRDVAAAAAFLAERRRVRHIAALGVSMGGVATVMAAAAEPRIGPLIIESSSYEAQPVFDQLFSSLRLPAGPIRSALVRATAIVGLWRMGARGPDILRAWLPPWRLAQSLRKRPVLLVIGDEDPLLRETAVRRYAARLSSDPEVVVFEKTGHGVFRPHPEAYCALVMKFLDRWRGAPS
jgi:pimeloyl-ACP methyl ester carboxylesterase